MASDAAELRRLHADDLVQGIRFRLTELRQIHNQFSGVIPTPLEEGISQGIQAAINEFEAEVLRAKSR